MNIDLLLRHATTLITTPRDVAKLRQMILTLAVQGKLVPQEAGDEPAEVLLKNHNISIPYTHKSHQTVTEFPFDVPLTWAWVSLPTVLTKLTDGTHNSPPNGQSGDYMYISAKNIKHDGVRTDNATWVSKHIHDEIYARCNPTKGDILYIKDGATTGVATINQLDVPFSMLSSVALLKPKSIIDNRYLLWVLRSPFYFEYTRNAMKGAAITRVTLSVMSASTIPLPPLAEQRRIVARVDELMAICDTLEAQLQARAHMQARVVQAALARVQADPSPASIATLLDPKIGASPADLRQMILTLAVKGKLVPQEAGDEPVEVASQKRTTNSQDFSNLLPQVLTSNHLPMNWTLTCLGNIADWGSGSTPLRSMSHYYGGNVVWLKSGELNDSQNVFDSEEHITEIALNECSFRKNKPGDVLIAMYGATIGKVAILATAAVTNQAVLGCTPLSCVYNRYLFYYLLSQKQNFMNMSEGGAQPNISKIKVQSYPFPLPPLAEQRRIVARVDELMALVDRLEAQQTKASALGAQVLDALVGGG